MTYTQIPSAAQFQKDSSISFAFRKDDTILKHLDWLLERHQARNSDEYQATRQAIWADLFLTCNFWIKSYHAGNKRTRKERYPAVLAVFEVVVGTLCAALNCNKPGLARILGEIYGRDMHEHGIKIDDVLGQAKYLSNIDRQVYRLRFRGGMAYQYQWWKKRVVKDLVPADSRRAYSEITRRGLDGVMNATSRNFGCFVMTMERELYMAKPEVGDRDMHDGFFHSTFTAGDVVTMAGTMLIKHGVIRGIRADSGHYRPSPTNMGLLLQGLAMYGVNLDRITMYGYDGSNLGSATDFIRFHMSWHQFERQRMAEIQRRRESDDRRVANRTPARFPHLPPLFAPVVAVGGPPVAPNGNADTYNA